MGRLTDLAVKNAKPQAARYELPDGSVPGLVLVVQPSGKKSWAIRYRSNGLQIKHTFGRFPEIDLPTVRDRAWKLRADGPPAAEQPDPATELAALPAPAATRRVFEVWASYIEHAAIKGMSANGVAKFTGIYNREIFPVWGSREIGSIGRDDVVAVLNASLLRGVSARNSLLAVLGSFIAYCTEQNIVPASPVIGSKPMKRDARDRILSDAEIAIFWRGCAEVTKPFGDLYRFLLLTGLRRNEAARMRRDEVDLKAGIVVIPRERMKGKPGKRRPHTVYLSPAALKIIKGQPVIEGCPFIFTTDGKTPVSGFSKTKADLDKAAPIKAWVLHDLRRTFRTGLSDLKVPFEIAERCIAHWLDATYDKSTMEAGQKNAWKNWARYVTKITKGN